jgi:hypothetical protein
MRPVFALYIAAVLATVSLGCGPFGRQQPTAQPVAKIQPTATPGSAPTITPIPSTAVATSAPTPAPRAVLTKDSVYAGVQAAVSRIRGLRPSRDVELHYMNQAELRQFFRDAFDREYSPEERASDQKLLVTLGLIRKDQDITELLHRVLSEQVIGLYDDDTVRMYLIGEASVPTPGSRVTFAHEFTHALQDEHFNLKVLNPPDSDNDDRAAAVQALVEGDATLTMVLFSAAELSAEERRRYAQSESAGGLSSFRDVPLVLREELLFPYIEGLRFVQLLHRQGGFAAIDAVFRDPPASTEQIIHPEKYLAREAPVAVTLPDLAASLGEGWRQTASNILGELDVRILVETYVDRPTAEKAAAGWGGDRYALLEDSNGRSAVVLKTVWDNRAEAGEFFQAYGATLRNRFGRQGRVTSQEADRQLLVAPGYATLVAVRGQEVVGVLAPDQPSMDLLAKALGW